MKPLKEQVVGVSTEGYYDVVDPNALDGVKHLPLSAIIKRRDILEQQGYNPYDSCMLVLQEIEELDKI